MKKGAIIGSEINEPIKSYRQAKIEMLIRMVKFLKEQGVIPMDTECLLKETEE